MSVDSTVVVLPPVASDVRATLAAAAMRSSLSRKSPIATAVAVDGE